eukprot:Phypoly_transcript_00666.p1 GENE.Phypoly_transcript_00666~~Phypoly_transcript_00666.p1  ORF type:complete len:1220 (+),score=294.05 Phypoly_transcript_00666:473-3661(+)
MNNSKPYVRKKAVLVMYKVFLKFPDSLRPSFGKLKEKLEDPDQAVISSAVNVICELARKNPKNYLSLAPTLFKLLTSNYNNWMLIKIIKLFGALTPLEPRLAKKLVEPLGNLINNTPATSLLYECIQTCTIGMGEQLSLIKLCITKLRSFVEDPDQNLKYLGLLALNNIMKIHPKAVAEHRDLILTCLDDEDVTIRMRALDLLTGMVSKRNLMDIVRKLLEHIEKAEGAYRDDLVDKIILLCSQNTYAHITDFEWYLTVLAQLTRVHGTPHGSLIASQILDVMIRVEVVRPFGVKQMVSLLRDSHLFSNPTSGGICEVLYAAAWSVGEFARNMEDISPTDVLGALLQPQAAALPPHIQSVFMQNALKIFAFVVAAAYNVLPPPEDEDQEEPNFEDITPETIDQANGILTRALEVFTHSVHIEIQKHTRYANEKMKQYSTRRESSPNQQGKEELAALFDGTLNPVAKGAQKKVPVPEDVDLDTPINVDDEEDENPFEEEEEEIVKHPHEESEGSTASGSENSFTQATPTRRSNAQEIARNRELRLQRNANNPYMLGGGKAPRKVLDDHPSSPPVSNLSTSDLGIGLVVGTKDDLAHKKKRGGGKVFKVKRDEDAPEGAFDNDENVDDKKKGAVDALSSINLDDPLGADEILPVARHRTDIQREKAAAAAAAAAKAGARGKGAEKERRGEGRERHGREGREERHRRSRAGKEGERRGKEGERPRPKAQTEGQLVDIGLDSPAALAVGGVTEDYQMLGSPPSQPIGIYAEKKKEGRERREGRDREGRGAREGRERRERRPEGERKHREHGEKREHGERREHGGKHEHRPERKERGGAPEKRALNYRPLINTVDISIVFDTLPSSESGKLQLAFLVENKTDADFTDLIISFTDSLTFRVAKSGTASCVLPEVTAGQKLRTEATATASSVQAQKLKGSVMYTYLAEPRKEDFVMAVPVSALVVATPVSKEDFTTILTTTQNLSLSSTRVKAQDFKSAMTTITNTLHLEPVQVAAENASAYGKSILGHHVALRLKAGADGGEVAVDIKSSDASLGSALIQEVTALFRP